MLGVSFSTMPGFYLHCRGISYVSDEQPEGTLQSSDNDDILNTGTHALAGELIAKHYEIIGEAGSGNVSRVYRARHLLINKIVAIKLLHQHNLAKANTVMRFQREATIVALLDHPNIVKFYEFGVHSTEQPYLILEFVEGKTLSQIVEEGGPMEPHRACSLFIQILDAIEHLHQNDILHRDIKPDNVMLNEKDVVKLVDFGFAGKHHRDEQEQSLTKVGEIFGTPNYMSPEQQMGKELDERSDIYSLSALLFFLLAGRPPFQAQSTLTTLMQHASEAPPSVASRVSDSELAKRLDDVIAHGLAKEPENRIQTIGQFRSEIEKILGVNSSAVRKTSAMSPISSSSKDQVERAPRSTAKVMKVTAGAAVLLLIVGGFIVMSNAKKADREREERAAKAKSEANRPQTREEMIALCKHLDMKGQTQFNTGQYALSEKTFRHALELGRQIDPDGPQVQNALEELIDLSTAQNKPPEPAWEKALKRITSVALKLQQKESAELKRDAERLAEGNSPGTKADMAEVKRVVSGSIECSQELYLLGDIDGALSLLNSLDGVGKRFPEIYRSWDAVVRYLKVEEGSSRSSADVAAEARPALVALERDIANARKMPDYDRAQLAEHYRAASSMALRLNDYPKAIRYLKESTDAVLSWSGSTSSRYANALIAEAFLYDDLGQRGKAQQKALAALKVYKGPKVSEASDPSNLNRVADIYTFLGDYSNAASTLSESLALQQKAEMKNYARIGDCLVQIAHVGVLQKHTEGLAPLLKRAIAIRKRICPEIVNYISAPLRMLGTIALLEGRAQEAEGFYKHALELDLSDKRDPKHASAAEDYAVLAKLYASYGTRGGDEKAVAALKSQIETVLRTYGNRGGVVIPVQLEIARIYEKRGEYDAANKILIEAERLAEKSEIPIAPRSLARVYMQHAKVLEEMGRPDEAAKLREKSNQGRY